MARYLDNALNCTVKYYVFRKLSAHTETSDSTAQSIALPSGSTSVIKGCTCASIGSQHSTAQRKSPRSVLLLSLYIEFECYAVCWMLKRDNTQRSAQASKALQINAPARQLWPVTLVLKAILLAFNFCIFVASLPHTTANLALNLSLSLYPSTFLRFIAINESNESVSIFSSEKKSFVLSVCLFVCLVGFSQSQECSGCIFMLMTKNTFER